MKNIELTKEEINTIYQKLSSKKSAERRSAAKKIGKFKILELEDDLLNAYLKERKDKRTWETQSAMIQALGRLGCKKSLDPIKEVIMANEEFDAITGCAATAYVRIVRKNKNDIQPIIELLKMGNHSVYSGALEVLTYDDMIPTDDDIKKIIQVVNKTDSNIIRPNGRSDVRWFLISAMSKWKPELTKTFFDECRKFPDLIQYIDAAMKGKQSTSEW